MSAEITTQEADAPLPALAGLDFKALFSGDDAIDPLITRIEADVSAEVPDTTTEEGRKRIASLAYKVARTKTLLDGKGKELTEEAKRATALIDARRKTIRDRLDALRDKTREPLDKWEAAEAERKAKLDAAIRAAGSIASTHAHRSAEVREELEHRRAMMFAGWTEDETAELTRIRDKAIAEMEGILAAAEKREADEAELAELRQMKVEKEAKEAKERAEKEAAEREAERQKHLAEAAEKARKEEAEAAERRIEEEKRKAVEEERARAAAEQRRRNEEAEAERIKQEKRERSQRARNAAGRAIMDSLLAALALDEATAREIATALLDGKIARVKVEI